MPEPDVWAGCSSANGCRVHRKSPGKHKALLYVSPPPVNSPPISLYRISHTAYQPPHAVTDCFPGSPTCRGCMFSAAAAAGDRCFPLLEKGGAVFLMHMDQSAG